jgi:hypothetical protein
VRTWLDALWGDLAGFGDWKEWTYYPYGPIFLHGMLDMAEGLGKFETERELLYAVGQRCLGFVHGGGVRGNPNSGAKVNRDNLAELYANPWNHGYYHVETPMRDGHFWYRLAKHFKDPEFLWAAEQVVLGGKPPHGKIPPEYTEAYNKRFAWFNQRGIKPKVPEGKAAVGLLSSRKNKIPERLYLCPGRQSGKPFASFFLYDKKAAHLDNISGHLYEYAANGAKFLHTSGKYSNVYRDNKPGVTGEESLDLLLVMKKEHEFPLHPDRLGDEGDYMRRGSAKHIHDAVKAENNKAGDSYGTFLFDNYYGPASVWKRQVVLTVEGYLVVLDRYVGGDALAENYAAGPIWHVACDEDQTDGVSEKNWFDAPAFEHAWWQTKAQRMLIYYHNDGELKFGSKLQPLSHDLGFRTALTLFANKPISAAKPAFFLSVFMPYGEGEDAAKMAGKIKTSVDGNGSAKVHVGDVSVMIDAADKWTVTR